MPAARTFLIAAVLSLAFVAGVVAPWMSTLALALDGVLVLLLIADTWRSRRIRIDATRLAPGVFAQGMPAECAVTVSNGSDRPVHLRLREALHPDLATGPATERMEVPALGSAVWRYVLTPLRRGEPSFGPLSVRVLGPWGLGWSERVLIPPQLTRVFPRIRFDGHVGRILALAQRRELGHAPVRTQGAGQEPYALREYRPGDSLSRIHWKASARHTRLVAREDSWERGRPLVLLLECGRSMVSLDSGRSKLDHALAAALALVRVAIGRGDRVTLLAFSNRVERLVRVHASTRGVSDAYRALFDVPARLVEPSYELAAETVLRAESRRATVVLFTSVVDLASAEGLRESLLRLRRRHQVIVENLEDSDLRVLATSSPSTAAEAFAKTSALEVHLANRRLGRQSRRAGIVLHSASADHLAASGIDAYLSLRASRRRI